MDFIERQYKLDNDTNRLDYFNRTTFHFSVGIYDDIFPNFGICTFGSKINKLDDISEGFFDLVNFFIQNFKKYQKLI
jgi:hypothetical protein